ncbi:MAG: UvrB/UvrC motif-containing protein, partial [Deltaproteobacteria bacterium]|nr:UvrB/UvrC motif-containing protein [Deltaproteobacteria bacterium]
YVSATPSDHEVAKAKNGLVEQIVRPTGLIDPKIDVRSAENQVDDLFEEIQICRKRNERVLVTTLTKRMAEDLTEYYSDIGIKVRYLHSDIRTLERMDIIYDLRRGKFDVLIGINLLREGLDIPEVSLVAILDADKEGFLRSTRSLVQTCGRASRNVKGQVIMYADSVTKSMKQAIDETNRRRNIQENYNKKHSITPESIEKSITSVFESMYEINNKPLDRVSEAVAQYDSLDDLDDIMKNLEKEMKAAADELEFEKAAELRDQIEAIKKMIVFEI